MEYTRTNEELLEKMNRIFADNGLEQLTASKRRGGSDAADTTLFGLPTVDSLGVRGGRIHSTDEYAYINSLPKAAKRLAAVALCLSV